ncbi:class I SAM-dependent methyltransferase [soil metagenome]
MQTDELADHLFTSALGTLDILSVAIGDRFGLYDVLAEGPLDEAEVARRSGMHPRYAREWLEQQTVAGLIDVDDPARAPESRRYSLPAEHAAVLVDRESLAFFAPLARLLAAAAVQLPALEEAYRSGGGVGWAAYGDQMRTAQAECNRPLYLGLLGPQWLPALPEVHQALTDGGTVADIGCGEGWSSIGIAEAYPAARVDGFDVDTASIDAARRHAEERGLGERVTFHLVDGAGGGDAGTYDLVTAFECVHDLPDPVSVLANTRRLVRAGGTVLVMDERVPETFTGPGDPVEQLMYGFSLLVCLPDGLSHDGSVGTGTVMRPDRLRGYAREAGFVDLEVLPLENDVFRFYRLFG